MTKILPKAVDISLIIPVFNEEQGLAQLFDRVQGLIRQSDKTIEIIFVNDGSTDHTAVKLSELYHRHKGLVRVIHFSRNFGHQLAITAGLHHCRGRAAVVMDADLQDPPELILDFIRFWEEGHSIVYGQRKKREGETWLKRWTAKAFYKLIRLATRIDIPEDVGDFYLLDRKVVDIINSLRERHRFIRGLVAWVGFKRRAVEYVRAPRRTGRSKFTWWRMVKFSFDAITSFSFLPLRVVSALGALISLASLLSIFVIVYMKLFTNATIHGWSSIMAVVLFIGGIQLMALGTIGEYIARIGDDVKARPLYAVSELWE